MRDNDVSYIVIEREQGGSVGSFLLGALVGAGIALLFAPQSGAETQEEIRARARQLKAQAEARVRAVQEELESRLEQARAGVQSRIDGVRGAVDQGRQAARDAALCVDAPQVVVADENDRVVANRRMPQVARLCHGRCSCS